MGTQPFFERRRNRRVAAIAALIGLTISSGCVGVQREMTYAVPEEYRPLYGQLEENLSRFQSLLATQEGEARPVLFAAELLPANAHRGTALFGEESWRGTMLYLDRLQEMGVRGVKVAIKYPVLLDDFPDSNRYLAFYVRLSEELRRRDMKMLAGTGPLFTDPTFSDVPMTYAGLTFECLEEKTRRHVEIILKEIRPDYLTVANEPATESGITGMALPPERFVELVANVLDGLDRGETLLGAGAGNWDDPRYIEGLARDTDVDYIDLHVYPVNHRFLERALHDVDVARSYGKRVIIGECWLYKAGEDELGGASASDIIARDVFGFWQPLDSKFLSLLAEFAGKCGIEFVSAFWSKYFFGYVDYDATRRGMSPKALLSLANEEAYKRILSGEFSQTGRAYRTIIRKTFP